MRTTRFDDPILHAALALALAAAGCVRSQPKGDDPSGVSGTTSGTVEAAPAVTAPDGVPPEPTKPETQATPPTAAPEPQGWSEACKSERLPGSQPVVPAASYDGWVVRMSGYSRIEDEETDSEAWRTGTPCATAADTAACEAALSAPMPQGALRSRSSQMSSTRWQGVATAGDRVERITDLNGLKKFLGPIDAEADAVTLVWAMGYDPTCVLPRTADGSYVIGGTQLVSDCPFTNVWVRVTVAADGSTQIDQVERKVSGACAGRLPAAPVAADLPETGVDGWIARAAWLEAQAVHAFAHLERELRHHGAPEALIAACAASRDEEVRHAQLVGEVARARGIQVPPACAEVAEVRSIFAIALDNAVEGLVRETWGAAVGLHQAERAQDPQVRRLMASIAPDEVQHAAFSRALHRWLDARLSVAEREQVEQHRLAAWRSVLDDEAEDPAASAALGLPARSAVPGMVRALSAARPGAGPASQACA